MPSRAPHVGVVGAGQLARMLQQAAIPLGVQLQVLAAQADDAAAQVCPDVVIGAPDVGVGDLAARCSVVTFDHELVAPDALAAAEQAGGVLRPTSYAQAFAQDKVHQRRRFADAGLAVPPHAVAERPEQAQALAADLGWPLVLKAPRGGYDGRGVAVVQDPGGLASAWNVLGGGPLLCETSVDLVAELAVLVARRPGGEAVTYPVVGTVQEQGICTELIVPAPVPADIARRATAMARDVAAVVDHAGILAVELFYDGEGLLINEVATRPHNSGHWTIEGAATSQFANHLRGVLDWPLGDPTMTAGAVVTVNLLGPADNSDPRSRLSEALAVPGAAIHLYGKAPRPGRKLGHVTATGDDVADAGERARRAAALLTGGAAP